MYSNRVPRELSQETRHCLTRQPSLSATWGFMTGCLYDNKQADRHTFSLWYGGLLLLCMGCCPARFFSYGVLPSSPRPSSWVSRWMRIQGSGVLPFSPRPSPWVSRWIRIQGSGVLPSSPRPLSLGIRMDENTRVRCPAFFPSPPLPGAWCCGLCQWHGGVLVIRHVTRLGVICRVCIPHTWRALHGNVSL